MKFQYKKPSAFSDRLLGDNSLEVESFRYIGTSSFPTVGLSNLGKLANVDTTGVVATNVLGYNGTKWVPAVALTESSSVTNTVDVTSAGSGAIITATERTNFTEVHTNAVRKSGDETIDGNKTFTGTTIGTTAAAGTNTTQLATTEFVKTAIDNLVDSAPGAMDTLNELAAALGDDENFSTTMTNALAGKQPTIGDGDLTIARTDGLQTALDGKQSELSATNRLDASFIGGGNVSTRI